MTSAQKRSLAKKIYKEMEKIIDFWSDGDFIKIHWDGSISIDGEYFEHWRLAEDAEKSKDGTG